MPLLSPAVARCDILPVAASHSVDHRAFEATTLRIRLQLERTATCPSVVAPGKPWVCLSVYMLVWSIALLCQPLLFTRAQMTEHSSSTGSGPSPTVCHFNLTTSNPSLSTPFQLTVDNYGSIYVVDSGNKRVVKLDRNGTQLLVFTISPVLRVVDIALVSSGELFVLTPGRVVIFSPNATQLQAVQPVYPSISAPFGLVLDSAGDLIITETPGGYVFKYSINGSLLQETSFAPPGTPFNLALDSDENIYFSAPYNNKIVKLAPNFTVVTQYTTSDPPLNRPFGLFVASDGSIYIADCDNNRVVQLAANGTQLAVFATDDPPMNCTAGVAVNADGDVIVSDYYNNRVVVFSTSQSACQQAQSSSSSSASVTSPLPSSSRSSSSSSVITSTLSTSTTFLTSPYTGGKEESSSSSSSSSAPWSTASSSASAALSSSAFLTSQYGGGSSSSSPASGASFASSSSIGTSTSPVLSSTSLLPASSSSSSSSDLSGGAIAGIVASVVAALALLCLVLAWRLRARWSRWSIHSRFDDDDQVEFTDRATSPPIKENNLLPDRVTK